MKNPIQPIVDGRFKENKIVCMLIDWATERGMDLNKIAVQDFTNDDRQQFAQLIGYSLSGYSELSYVDDDAYGAAATMFEDGLTEDKAKIVYLENELSEIRQALMEPVARIFGIHPDDLNNISE